MNFEKSSKVQTYDPKLHAQKANACKADREPNTEPKTRLGKTKTTTDHPNAADGQ